MFGPVMPMGCFLRPTESDKEKKYGQSFLYGAAIHISNVYGSKRFIVGETRIASET